MSDSKSHTPPTLPSAPSSAVRAWLLGALRERRANVAIVLVLFLLEAAAGLVFPLVIGSLVDAVIAQEQQLPTSMWWQLALLGVAAVASGVLSWAGGVLLARIAETIIAELREEYVAAALRLPRAVVEESGTGDIVTRASDDISQISSALPEIVPRIAVSLFTLILIITSLGAMNPWFLLGCIVAAPIYAWTVIWYLKTAPAVYGAERVAQSSRGQRILGTLTQLPTISAHALERHSLTQAEESTWQTVRWAMRARIVQNRLFGRMNLAEASGIIVVLGMGVWLAAHGTITAGEATTAALLFLRMIAPIKGLMFVMDDFQTALAALSRLVGVIDAAPSPVDPEAEQLAKAEAQASHVVELRGVDFSYRPGVPVLRDVTLELASGKTTAVVGATGSGKSTLAAVISGVHAPIQGELIRHTAVRNIVTVAQETHIFAATLRENLTLAAPHASDEILLDQLRAVGGQSLLDSLPHGLDSNIGHGGYPLSASHAQRLALTRVALADPDLVILDEATAEADTADTTELDRAADAVIAGRTALVIAHRLSQATSADRIIVMESGRITETGTHTDLLQINGSYARLWEAWNRGRTSEGNGAESR